MRRGPPRGPGSPTGAGDIWLPSPRRGGVGGEVRRAGVPHWGRTEGRRTVPRAVARGDASLSIVIPIIAHARQENRQRSTRFGRSVPRRMAMGLPVIRPARHGRAVAAVYSGAPSRLQLMSKQCILYTLSAIRPSCPPRERGILPKIARGPHPPRSPARIRRVLQGASWLYHPARPWLRRSPRVPIPHDPPEAQECTRHFNSASSPYHRARPRSRPFSAVSLAARRHGT